MEIKITKFTHFFKVSEPSPLLQPKLIDFIKAFLLEPKLEYRDGKYVKVPGRVFATRTRDKREYRFHINCLEIFTNYFTQRGCQVVVEKDESVDVYPGDDALLVNRTGNELRDYQQDVVDWILQPGTSKVVELAMGKGKGLSLDTLIRFKNGWVPIRDVKTGDEILTPSGEVTKIIGVFDNQNMDCYRITFDDRRSCICDTEHLWEIYSRKTNTQYETIGMKEVLRRYEKGIEIEIPLTSPLGSADEDLNLPVDPYVVGVFLGDGTVSTDIFGSLKLLGLERKLWWEKFIPKTYLNASFDQRLSLTQGLLDTDKTVNVVGDSPIGITTTSEMFAKQIVELARSLGAKAEIVIRQMTIVYAGDRRPCKPAYHVRLYPQITSLFFRTPSNGCETEVTNHQMVKALRLKIKKIEYVGKQDTRCIKVDHPNEMYVIQDYICTHNTFSSLYATSKYGKKVCIFVLGRYTDRWWEDIGNWVDNVDILEIRGSLELEDVLRNCESPIVRNKKMFVMTITTFSDYCTKWENASFEDRQDMVPPELVWEVLGVGIRITDETHQHFHQNFLTDLYTHIPKAIYLSATLQPGDAFLRRMYEIFLPIKNRVGGGLQDKYTRVYAMFYRFNKPNKIRCQNRKRMYNHTEFEKWLMRDPKLLLNYFSMIDEYVEEKYLSVRKDKQKLLIFFGTKLMCEKYAKHLKMKWPNIDSRKYVSEDKYENLLQADIACSTLGSSGTAVDIPNLLRCLMTTALKSEQANLQALGRLRKLNDETEFTYLVCTDIPKHLEYHEAKKRLFRDWVKSQQIYFTEKSI